MLNLFEMSNSAGSVNPGLSSIPAIEDLAANRPEQVVYALGTGIVGLLLQTRPELHYW